MKRYILFAAAAVIAMGMVSCEDTLTEKPDSYYDKDTYFDSDSKAEMAIYGIYSSISNFNHYGQNEMATPASDDTYFINGTTPDNTRRDIAHYMVTPGNSWLANIWKYDYQGIDRANLAIDGTELSWQLQAAGRFTPASFRIGSISGVSASTSLPCSSAPEIRTSSDTGSPVSGSTVSAFCLTYSATPFATVRIVPSFGFMTAL